MVTDAIFDPYIRRVRLDRVVDGDTIDVHIDLGFRVGTSQRLRLADVATPELRSSDPDERIAAKAAKKFVTDWTRALGDWPLIARTEKQGSFNRWLAIVYRTGDPISLNQALLAAGHAEVYEK